MIEERQYQRDLVDKTAKILGKKSHGPSVMLQSATGSGKTVMGIMLLQEYLEEFPNRCHAWVTDRNVLRKQSSKRLRKSGLRIAQMAGKKPDKRRWLKGYVNVVSPKMRIWPRLPKLPGLMIVDEAHHAPASTWGRLIDQWRKQGGFVVGLTATPWRLSKRQGFEDWFDELVCGPSIRELQDMGQLATPRVISPFEIDDSEASHNSMGEFSYEWMESEVLMMLAHRRVIEHWQENTKQMRDKRTLWFVPTQHCAEELTYALNNLPDGENRAEVLIADTPEAERDRILAALKYKRIDHLVSVDVLGEGLDVPSVPIVASMRQTESVAVHLQQYGRGSRPKNKTDGGHYWAFDYAGNCQRHGPPDLDREWSLEPRVRLKSTLPQDVVARCYNQPECSDIYLHPSNRSCWNCNSEQYFICSECKVHRRWTRFRSKDRICDICHDYAKAKEKEAELERIRQTTGRGSLRNKIKKYGEPKDAEEHRERLDKAKQRVLDDLAKFDAVR